MNYSNSQRDGVILYFTALLFGAYLSDVTFSVEKGMVHALIGENGAGKSILMKVLTGAYSD